MNREALFRAFFGFPLIALGFWGLHIQFQREMAVIAMPVPIPRSYIALVGLYYGPDIDLYKRDRAVLMGQLVEWTAERSDRQLREGFGNTSETMNVLKNSNRAIVLLNSEEGYVARRVVEGREELLISNGGGLVMWPVDQLEEVKGALQTWLES